MDTYKHVNASDKSMKSNILSEVCELISSGLTVLYSDADHRHALMNQLLTDGEKLVC